MGYLLIIIFSLRLLCQDLEQLHVFISLLRSLQCVMTESIVFISPTMRQQYVKILCFPFCYCFYYTKIKRKIFIFILLLPLLQHDHKKYSCFSFHCDVQDANISLDLPTTLTTSLTCRENLLPRKIRLKVH